MRLHVTALLVVIAALAISSSSAAAHLVAHHKKGATLQQIAASQKENLAHAKYVCRHGAHAHKRWSCKAVVWLKREYRETQAALHPTPTQTDWASVQIHYATIIGAASSRDPWPNCPDPFDGRGSWSDTVACENGGNWYDSPGYYRCGLQFDPGWEVKYRVRFCP